MYLLLTEQSVKNVEDLGMEDRRVSFRGKAAGNFTLDLPEWMYVRWEMSQEAFEPSERRSWGIFGPTKVLRLNPKSKAEAYQCLSPSNKFTGHKTRR